MGIVEASQEALPSGVAEALGRLLGLASWEDEIDEVLGLIGEALAVDRCYVFQNVRGPDGRLWMDLRAEWKSPGTNGLFRDPRNHLHPYFPDFAAWIDEMGAGKAIAGPVSTLPESARRPMSEEGTFATAQVPVRIGDEWWGFVAVDVCTAEHPIAERHHSALVALAGTLGQAQARARVREDERLKEDLYRRMVEEGPAVTYIDGVDEGASTVYISPQIHELLGYTPKDWYADPDLWSKVLHPDDRARAVAENARHNETGERFVVEYRMQHRDGHYVWVHDEASMAKDERGAARYSHGVMVGIDDRKAAEERLALQAYHDELTGLPSSAMFEELLDLSVARARQQQAAVAVLSVDIDDFRLVNDSLGHQSGDALLQHVADRLRGATRETDLVARKGGDQFQLLLSDLDRDEGSGEAAAARSRAVAERIQDELAAPFEVNGTEIYVSASIGISIFPTDAGDSAALQRNVEAAMYEAKKAGSASFVMASGVAADSGARLQFMTRLRKAVETQRWTLHYQPVLELSEGRMVGVEALIRWIEPDGTMVPPLEFIPLAEELGLIEQIGEWVVREIAYQVQAWRELDIDLEIGFNLSPRQFWQRDLASRIVREFHAGGVDTSRVLLEVTESSAMMDPDRAQGILTELHSAGFKIAIDDFGTGYSSLSRLREMPVDVLKIDRSFVRNLHEDREAASIVSAFLELATGLQITTLAEGIETQEELAFLRDRGCQLGQGFLFSRPVPPEEIIACVFGGIPAAMALR